MSKRWYLIAYDIRHDRRLTRLHYYLSKQAIAMQKSVFVAKLNRAELGELKKQIRTRVANKEDDVRIYPVRSPELFWFSGQQKHRLSELYCGEHGRNEKFPLSGIFRRVFEVFSMRHNNS